jgi:hypothetical protein
LVVGFEHDYFLYNCFLNRSCQVWGFPLLTTLEFVTS